LQNYWSEDVLIRPSLYEPDRKRLRRDLVDLAAEHGFMMYGMFLSHPAEWPFSDESPSSAAANIEQPVQAVAVDLGLNDREWLLDPPPA
jgi:hypothetical protein